MNKVVKLFILMAMLIMVIGGAILIVTKSNEHYISENDGDVKCDCPNNICTSDVCPNACETDPLFKSNNLIGLMYPPRLGPLQTNYEFPLKHDSCKRPFVALYDTEPFLRQYNVRPKAC
jgi:hypothetical protein